MSITEIGKNVRSRREAMELSLDGLAAKAEVAENTLGSFERGQTGMRLDVLLKVLGALELKLVLVPNRPETPNTDQIIRLWIDGNLQGLLSLLATGPGAKRNSDEHATDLEKRFKKFVAACCPGKAARLFAMALLIGGRDVVSKRGMKDVMLRRYPEINKAPSGSRWNFISTLRGRTGEPFLEETKEWYRWVYPLDEETTRKTIDYWMQRMEIRPPTAAEIERIQLSTSDRPGAST